MYLTEPASFAVSDLGITSDIAKAPDNVLWMVLAVSGAGAVFLLPTLAYLFVLFKSAAVQRQISAKSTNRLKDTK